MKRQWVWLTFDLGIDGDYEQLYYWLDSKEARECGDNVAAFYYEPQNDIVAEIKKEISEAITLRRKDRIYLICKDKIDGKAKFLGRFIFGKRKPSPWEGYANSLEEVEDDG